MHKACHFAISTISRSQGRSAVAAAAYRLAQRLWDERHDCWRDYRAKRDVVHGEYVGWSGDAGQLWRMAEAAETRVNSRVAREMTIFLPCELPLGDQIALARGFCLWLRDTFGMASTFAIHHPGKGGLDREIMEDLLGEAGKRTEHRGDPRNHHLHVLSTDRACDPESGALGEKVRAFTSREEGPVTVRRCREEWQRCVNAKLTRRGLAATVDLRSHAARAAAVPDQRP